MIYTIPEYEEGFRAALNGKTEKDCPYEEPERIEGVYRSTAYDRWMSGFRAGQEACPHCRGTGKKPELTKEQRMRKGLFLHNLIAESKKPLR